MKKYKLAVGRTLAHLHEETYGGFVGLSFPYVKDKDKELADKIVELLNKDALVGVGKE